MGDSYKLSADGTSTNDCYGLAWTHENIGGQSKSGLNHQLLILNGGVTKTAIGAGIWTSGNIKFGQAYSGASSSPACLDTGYSYSDGTTKDKLKLKLYDNYGFTVGSTSDVQYHSEQKHDFYISNSRIMRIQSDGAVINSGMFLGMNGGTTYGLGVLSANRNSAVFDTIEAGGTDSLELNYYTGGEVHIGQGGNKGLRAGYLIASGEVTAYSDKRLKENIQPLKVRGELNPVTYTKDGKASIGFIAQEVKEVYPELVVGDESKEMLSLNYQQLTAVLYAEIKELKERIKKLEGEK